MQLFDRLLCSEPRPIVQYHKIDLIIQNVLKIHVILFAMCCRWSLFRSRSPLIIQMAANRSSSPCRPCRRIRRAAWTAYSSLWPGMRQGQRSWPFCTGWAAAFIRLVCLWPAIFTLVCVLSVISFDHFIERSAIVYHWELSLTLFALHAWPLSI